MFLTQWMFSILFLANAGATAGTTIAVFPTEQFEKSQLARPLAAELVSKLRRPGWKIINGMETKGVKSFLKPVKALMEGRDAKRAMSLDADIYIVFEGNLMRSRGGKTFQLMLGAYETATARKMGAEAAMSSPGSGDELAMAKEACERAVPTVVKQVTDYQKADAKRGVRYNIVLYNAPENTDMKLHPFIKKVCPMIKTKRHDERLSFYSLCRVSRKEVIGAVKKGIHNKLGRKKYIIYPSPRQLIVIDFQ